MSDPRAAAYRDGVVAVWMDPLLVGGMEGEGFWEIWEPETFETLAGYGADECASADEALTRYLAERDG